MSGLDYSGTLRLQQQMRRLEGGFDQFLRQFLLKQALDALERTKAKTPQDSGQLREAWTISEVQQIGGTLAVTLSNPTAYASSVEYGHIDSGRTNWVEGKFMCTLAIDEVAKLIPQRFNREFAAWVRRLGL